MFNCIQYRFSFFEKFVRIEEVIQNVKDHIGDVVLSGSDENVDTKANPLFGMQTLQPLYQGDFDVTRVLRELAKIDYNGKMGYINHRFERDKDAWNIQPSDYLKKSMNTYNEWLKELDRSR